MDQPARQLMTDMHGDDITGVPHERDESERRIYLVWWEDLPIPLGKALAQAGHAFLGVVEAARKISDIRIEEYLSGQQPKIAISAKNLEALRRAVDECRKAGIPACVITDAGRTVFTEPTVTCAAIGPVLRSDLPKYVSRMRLL